MPNLKNYPNKKNSVNNKTVFALKFDHFLLSPKILGHLKFLLGSLKRKALIKKKLIYFLLTIDFFL